MLMNLMFNTSKLLEDSTETLEKIVSQIHLKEHREGIMDVDDDYETDGNASSDDY